MSDLTYYVLIAIAVHLCLTLLQALYRRLQNEKLSFDEAFDLVWLCLPVYVYAIHHNLGGESDGNILSFLIFGAFWIGFLPHYIDNQCDGSTPRELRLVEIEGGKFTYLLFVLPVLLFWCWCLGILIQGVMQAVFDALMGWYVGVAITGFAAHYLYWYNKKNKLSETNRKEGAYQYDREQQRRILALEDELKKLREELAGYRPEHSTP
jgi:hypothetical protein